ncbi:MAG TPA: alanine racemase [Anaerolineales bacterium]|nr:alanine racemase [Anaerolineales bacterium]
MLYQTHARIHLDHIRFNIDGIRRAVGPQRKILIAVKANAYGHGAVEVSRMAERIGVDWLGVATVPEGIQLREASIGLPILKFSPAFEEEMDAALRSGITLAVCERANVDALEQAARSAGVQGRVHLKVDTGMGRIGVSIDEAPALAAHIEQHCPSLRLEGIFTHLPVSDAADPAYTRQQIERFKDMVEAIQSAIGRKVDLVHCANSGAVLGHEPGWLDMVRPGIMIYGFYPDPGTPRSIPLKPGLSFLTRVSFVKKVPAGTSIGYGRTWFAPEDTWIATIPAGYADGLNRLFSNCGRALVNGRSCPVVGRVCMDQSMLNLGPETDVQVGDTVVLIGRSGDEEITCDEWAEKLHTITYEVTCQINARVARVYDPYTGS